MVNSRAREVWKLVGYSPLVSYSSIIIYAKLSKYTVGDYLSLTILTTYILRYKKAGCVGL